MSRQNKQKGGSGVGMIIMLVILGYGVFIAIQYVPQHIESTTVDAILESVVNKNNQERLGSVGAIQGMLDMQLYLNEMADLKDSFSVQQNRGQFVITVHYERELNLLFETKTIPFDKTVMLN